MFLKRKKKFPELFGDFPSGPVVKNLPADAVDTGSIPGVGRLYMPQGN